MVKAGHRVLKDLLVLLDRWDPKEKLVLLEWRVLWYVSEAASISVTCQTRFEPGSETLLVY